MSPHDLFSALQATPFATAIREGELLFPWIESIHVLAITLVVGTISVVDLRLLGVPAHRAGLRKLMADVLPFTWGAFAVAVVSGFLMFSSSAVKYSGEITFQVKMVLLVLAGLNMAFFHFITFRSVDLWDEMVKTPFAAKLAGGGSLVLWASVVLFGRLVGFAIAASS
jgi:hypothetical protein